MIAVVKSERQGRRSIQSVNHRFFRRWFGAPLGASMMGRDLTKILSWVGTQNPKPFSTFSKAA